MADSQQARGSCLHSQPCPRGSRVSSEWLLCGCWGPPSSLHTNPASTLNHVPISLAQHWISPHPCVYCFLWECISLYSVNLVQRGADGSGPQPSGFPFPFPSFRRSLSFALRLDAQGLPLYSDQKSAHLNPHRASQEDILFYKAKALCQNLSHNGKCKDIGIPGTWFCFYFVCPCPFVQMGLLVCPCITRFMKSM